MKKPNKHLILFLLILLIAVALRLPKLTQRPMHTDEAVHAIKFGELLENGVYRYDPHEYHGPTLNYLTLIPAMLTDSHKLTDITERTLRIVPVFFGLMLIVLLLLMRQGFGWRQLLFAALFTAISPAMVFYSRYYIQEILLVCFTFGTIICGYRYLQHKKMTWAMLTGLFVGLMHSTKETWIIAVGALGLAGLFVLVLRYKSFKLIFTQINTIGLWHFITLIVVAIFVSVLFYSSFFTNPAGIIDSVKTYTTYFQRAGQSAVHIHPWYFYLKILIYHRTIEGPIWCELVIFVLAVIGFIVAFTKKFEHKINIDLLRLIAFYTIIMTIIYSFIPYKTPWNMLGFLHGMILLAGVGAVVLIELQHKRFVKILIIVGIAHLSWLSYQSNYKYEAHPSNPYVYGHTASDIFSMVKRIEEMAQASPEGNDIFIEVLCPGDDYWPLPWYLRAFNNVGWWNHVDLDILAAPIIIASPKLEPDLIHKLYDLPPPGQKNLYLPLFDDYVELRPHVELRGYVVKDLWDRFHQSK